MSAAPHLKEDGFWSLFDLNPMVHGGLERYLQASLDRCTRFFRASGASIFLLDEASGQYLLKARSGRQTKVPADAVIHPGEGLAGQVILLGEAQVLNDDHRTLRLHEGPGSQDIASSMIVPLLEPRQGVIGVLNLSRTSAESPFEQADLERALAMAVQVTLAVLNARLVERLNDAVTLSRESRERLSAVLDSVPGGVIVMDNSGTVVSASPWALSEGLFGANARSEPSLLEKHIHQLAMETLAERAPKSQTVVNDAVDRTWILQSQPMSHGGTVISVQEITQHERSQREVHRLSRLAEIGRMTAAIAHEFRNPLTGIRSAAQMIQSSPEYSKDFGQIIEDEVIKLNTLCTEFLEFARPMALDRDEMKLSEAASRVVDLLQTVFTNKGIGLKLEVEPIEAPIYGDMRKLEQVFHNLVRNALEATPAGGEVIIRVERKGFEVCDNGIGMSEEAQEKLFSPFFTTKPQGTGLGLSTVRKIVEAHGGTVMADSKLGVGTTFRVLLR